MTDLRVTKGNGWIRCSICGRLHMTHDKLHDDGAGPTDVCQGECAADAGLVATWDRPLEKRCPRVAPHMRLQCILDRDHVGAHWTWSNTDQRGYEWRTIRVTP